MRYFVNYFQDDPNGISIHLDKVVTDVPKKFDCPGDLAGCRLPLPQKLFEIPGVSAVHVSVYEIFIGKGNIFTWHELLPVALEVIRSMLDNGGVLVKARSAFVKTADGNTYEIDPKVHAE